MAGRHHRAQTGPADRYGIAWKPSSNSGDLSGGVLALLSISSSGVHASGGVGCVFIKRKAPHETGLRWLFGVIRQNAGHGPQLSASGHSAVIFAARAMRLTGWLA